MTYESFTKFYNTSNDFKFGNEDYMNIPLEYYNPSNGMHDCVFRAISKILNLDFCEAKEQLINYVSSHNPGSDPTLPENYSAFLEEKYNAVKITSQLLLNRINGYNFIKIYNIGTYVIRTQYHVYPIINGCAYDNWNPLGDIITSIWLIPQNNNKEEVLYGKEN